MFNNIIYSIYSFFINDFFSLLKKQAILKKAFFKLKFNFSLQIIFFLIIET